MQSAVRILIAVVAGCLIAVGLLTIALGQVFSGAWTLLLGLVGIVVALYERRRYGAARDPATEARLRPTDEVFIDPSTGVRMRVHLDPESGERHYLPEAGAARREG
jgi:hypothetical protein